MSRCLHFFLIIVSAIEGLLSGCHPSGPQVNAPHVKGSRDNWILSGRIATRGFTNGHILALGLDGMRYRSRIAQDDSFLIQLPGNSSYAVYFLEPISPDKDTETFDVAELTNAGDVSRKALL